MVIVKMKWLFCVMKGGCEKEKRGAKVIGNVRRINNELIIGSETYMLIVSDQCIRPLIFLLPIKCQ